MGTLKYRPAIDGLRAIAVGGVVLFHLHPDLLSGGFVGVDVFFVISGFLLTRIIYQKHERGTFSYGEFYQRRVARLFPVLLVVTAVILLVARLLYLPQDYSSTAANAVASIFSLANVKLMLMGSYFDVSEDAVPFLHFWSLSLEEQFYVFLPLTIGLLFRNRASVRTSALWLSLIAASSFAGSLYLTSTAPRFAFYLLPTRAWELLAGSLLALTYFGSGPSGFPWLSRLTKPVGIVLVVVSFVAIDGADPFPGWVALFPVLGTLALLLEADPRGDRVERALAFGPLVWIGRLSYSIYLWHWPVFAFVDYGMYEVGWPFRIALKVSITAAASAASYFLIEAPARDWINGQQRRATVFAVATVAVVAMGAYGYTTRKAFYLDAKLSTIAQGGILVNGDGRGKSVALIGDSKGSMYGLTMRDIAGRIDSPLSILSRSAGNPIVGSTLFESTMKYLRSARPDVVVVGAEWSVRVADHPERLYATLDSLLKCTDRIVLLTEPPVLPEIGTREHFRQNGPVPLHEEPKLQVKRARAEALLRGVESERVTVVDVAPHFLRRDSAIAFTDAWGRQLFQDRKHLSPYGAQLVADEIVDAIDGGDGSAAEAETPPRPVEVSTGS